MSCRIANKPDRRRGTVLLMVTAMVASLFTIAAFGLDIGFVILVRAQLQAAADSAAMTAAASMGLPRDQMVRVARKKVSYYRAADQEVALFPSDIEYGTWDATLRQFTPSATVGNAVRVTTRTDESARGKSGPFWGGIFGRMSFAQRASAVAMANPRDIAFVVDLSGSMNDDTEPCWATAEINRMFGSEGHPAIGNALMQELYADLGFGPFPGPAEYIGQPTGISNNEHTYAELTKNDGPLTDSDIPSQYQIRASDSAATRKTKAYSAIIDYQIARLMPNAMPAPNLANYAYWEKYIDYVCCWGTLRPRSDDDDSDGRETQFNNPNRSSYPSAETAFCFQNWLGYQTYVQFLLDHGRDAKVVETEYSPISIHSAYCPWHAESTRGGTFQFPPRTQPMHAARRALIAALQVVKERNARIPDHNHRDWVSMITFDSLTNGSPVIAQPLTADCESAMLACTRFQAVGDLGMTTCTESGLIAAREHLAPASEGGSGRQRTNKIVVLLTSGIPQLYSSDPGDIDQHISHNPDPNFYNDGNYGLQAPLVQAMRMQADRWQVFPVGIGMGVDYDFMDRMARLGGTAHDDGKSPRGSGNPAEYEQRLNHIFEEIITNPPVRLVQ